MHLASCVLLALLCLAFSIAADTVKPATMPEVIASSKAADWRALDPEATIYLEFAAGRVVIDLSPTFAPRHVANVKAMARERYFDGLAIVRVQDNYVVQLADPNAEDPKLKRRIIQGKATLPPEFEHSVDPSVPFTRLE